MPISANYTCSDASTGRITIDGIPRGVGLNLGNALRRTLLSQLEGAAVTAVRINGALHEFDCIDGVKEDVTEIIGNLRKLDLRLDGDGSVVARIATNQREVKALDIQTDGSLEVLNPDLHIATLNPGASLQMEIEIEKGRGFRHAKENLKSGHPENTIPMASDFSPVRRVGYSIEQIDEKTEKLVVQIETNGSVGPVDAALQAIDLLICWLRMDSLVSHSNYNGDAGEFHLDEIASHNLGSALRRELLAYEVDGDRPVLDVELRDSSMKIRTDGTMNPKTALESAASGLRERFAELRKAIAGCERAPEQPPMSPFDKGDYASQMQAQPIVFSDTAFAEEAPDLLAIQFDSYKTFLWEGLPRTLSEAFPITDDRGKFKLELVGHRLEKPALDAGKCILYLRTYSAPLWISLRLSVKENGSTKEGEICMGEIPLMTERGTFIINGVERVVVSQLHRSPGAFFTEETDRSGKKLHTARIVPYRGAWLELESDPEGRINARIDRRKRICATVLLRALGWETDEEILSLFAGMTEEETEPIRKTLEDDVIKTESDALMEILKLFHIEPELDIENARSRFQRFFFDPARYDLFRVGRAMLNRRLGTDVPEDETILRKEDVVETLKYLLKFIHGEKKPDDMEHLGNRRVRSVGELLQIQLLIGLSRIARTAKESLAVQDLENAAIQDIIHSGSLSGFIEEFFESSELSQVMQQTNPLDELTHARRLSLLGPGGVHRDRAIIEVRDVHHSHSGRICPIETPEGPSVGLILSLANHARMDKYGFLEAPYRKVENGEKTDLVEYLTADKTDGRVIADSVRPSVAYRDDQMVEVDESDVDYVALYPQQILGTSASLIPLIEHNDHNRALMGANMQRQAVPLLHPEAPLVRTGMERKAAVDSRAVVRARGNGKVKKATSREIVIAYADGKCEIYRLVKHRRSNGNHQMDQRPVVSAGQSVHRGQIIADCQSSENGVLSLGRNILVAYMPWEGYNFEGGIVISDRLVKDDVFTSVSIESFRVEARETEHGVEYFTRDVPDKEKFWQLEENGIVKEGKWVKPGDVLVGKLMPVSDMRLETGDLRRETSDVRLETGDKSREVRYEDASQVVPPYVEGQVIRAIHLSRKRGDDLPAGVEEVAIVHVAVRREVKVGDKFAGRHGNKGVISKIVPEEDMPFLPDGTPIQMILNPLGIPARMNLGQILETHLGWAASKLGGPIISPPYDGASNEDIKGLLQRADLPEDGMTMLFDGRDGRAFDTQVTVGYQYQMKLYHQVDDKIHARASGPYSILTGQPLGGRSRFGGQRCGEMEIWALQAYGAAHTLHEMMTLKAISTAGVRTYEALAKGEEVHSTDYEGDTPSFKLLTNWMRGLCIDMTKDEEGVKVRLASPEEIRGWSEGEVDVRLADGVTEGDRGDEKDTVLDELPNPDAMGHIELAAPVSHIWFLKGLPSRIGLAIYVAFRELEKVIYYESYVVLDSASDALSVGQILTPQEYEESKDKHEFRAGIGAGAIRELLERIDFDAAISEIRAQMEAKEIVRKLKKRLVLIQSLQRAGLRPEWMVTDVIPVVPYNVRPNVPLQEGEYATADLNTLYKRVIIRNNRLKRLMELKAPEAVIHNEKRALQEAVDALFDNGRHGRVARDESNRVLKSLSDLLKGKAGIFRGSLLGSRVDYSGRSVIVPGPELKLGECGLPIEMALILFEPFVIRLMRKTGRARTIMSAMRAVRQKHPEAVETLREVIADKLVLLNRAPTLHRASVQAFRPVLVDDRAMHLHPLVCYAFNADFDGDQMAVHVPVTPEAQKEARELMLSHRNILSPMTGRLLARPSMDLILGCHYLTLSQDAGNTGGANPFSYDEIKRAYELGEVGLHEEIQLNVRDEVMETTVGRAIFNDILGEKLPFVNETLDADRIFELVEMMYREHGEEEAVALLDRLKDLGFKFATRSGISISDLRPETGDLRLEDLDSDISGLTSENRYRDGLSQLEYFTLTHGARMRLANTVLKVESSGYLTRKLAVVASDVVVMEEDCGTQRPRNVVNCETLYGVCAKCYGIDLSTGQPVRPGTPVGIIAATAIGVPLVQLSVSPSTAIPKLTQLFEARSDAEEALFEVDGESFRSLSELLQARGVESLHKHLLKAMMDVYHSHGIETDAKHFEVVIRQMLSPVMITDPGDTDFYVDQEVSREKLLLENARATENGGRPASFERIIRGITKAALTGDSFLVAASFQQTTNVLTSAVLRGQIDPLRGMRECVIVGKLMPVGTGFPD
jgi:DNA-directed RNA polymerase subunit beta